MQQPPVSPPPGGVPVVIISSARPEYLQQTLQALEPAHQNPNTPSWIQHSLRHVFVHWHELNNQDATRLESVQKLAQQHNATVHMFYGLGSLAQRNPNVTLEFRRQEANQTIAYFAKLAWYQQMRCLIYTLNVPEALLLEEDAVLAYDGLLTAAALFTEKWRRQRAQSANDDNDAGSSSTTKPVTVHAICLGAWSGESRINAHFNTLITVRSRFFQAMAYSMDRTVFARLQEKQDALPERDRFNKTDWTVEITMLKLIEDLNMLTPTVGRMHHIGGVGMGIKGDGKLKRELPPIHWEPWNASINNPQRTLQDYILDPPDDTVVADIFGFLCEPIRFACPGSMKLYDQPRYGNTSFPSRIIRDSYHLLPERIRKVILRRETKAAHERKKQRQLESNPI